MKTIREWLEQLPEPYRTQALENSDISLFNSFRQSKKSALKAAFIWNDSIQGGEYWLELYNTLNQPHGT